MYFYGYRQHQPHAFVNKHKIYGSGPKTYTHYYKLTHHV